MMKVILIEPEYADMANSYLAVDEKTGQAALIDPGCFMDNAVNAIKDSGADVRYVLLTHGHFDHILGLHEAKKITGAKIVIHPDDEICLRDTAVNLMEQFGVNYPLTPESADIYANDGDKIQIGETVFEVLHTPGHTPGGVCYINRKDNVIFSGDTLFCSTVGRTDNPGGDIVKMKESLGRILLLDGNFSVYPGHGPSTELDRERTHNIFIRRMNRH